MRSEWRSIRRCIPSRVAVAGDEIGCTVHISDRRSSDCELSRLGRRWQGLTSGQRYVFIVLTRLCRFCCVSPALALSLLIARAVHFLFVSLFSLSLSPFTCLAMADASAASSSSGAAGAGDDVEEQKNLSKEEAALDTVTDFAEEVEMDSSKAQAMLNNLTAGATDTEEQSRVAKELAAVQVKPEDIDMLAKELEISADDAENKIRQARGDVKLAITNALK